MRKKYKRKYRNKYNRKKVLQYTLGGVFIREWDTVGQIHREMGLDKSAVLRCCKGKQKKSYHFIWKFKDEVTSNEINMKNKDGSNNQEISGTFSKVKVQD
jgi:hypothetical protein